MSSNLDSTLGEITSILKSFDDPIVPEAEAVSVAKNDEPVAEAPAPDLQTPAEAAPISFGTEMLEKAQWTSAYINDLPDSAFLHVESGGKKDSDGKTTPRSLRHFPVKDADGKLDLPHLRNAIAQAPKSDLPKSVQDEVQSKGKELLDSVEKAVEKTLVQKDSDYYDHVAVIRAACMMLDGVCGIICQQMEVTPMVEDAVQQCITMLQSINSAEEEQERAINRKGVTKRAPVKKGALGRTLNRSSDAVDGWPTDLNSNAFLGDVRAPGEVPSFGRDGNKPSNF